MEILRQKRAGGPSLDWLAVSVNHEIMQFMAKQLFTKKAEEDKATIPTLVKWTKADIEKVRQSAALRKLNVNEFIRRAALGRKADVDIDTDIILSLSDLTRSIRAMHSDMVANKVRPPEAEMLATINEARAAIQRISK